MIMYYDLFNLSERLFITSVGCRNIFEKLVM